LATACSRSDCLHRPIGIHLPLHHHLLSYRVRSCYPTSEATSVSTYVEPNWPPSPHPQTGAVLPPPTPANQRYHAR
jgi:hypothetical protein